MILGAVLAGGRATRFGGDKGAAMLGGRALIDHAADAIRPFCAALVVVGRDWPGLARVDDWPSAGLGPLGGLAGALRHARDGGYAAVLSIGGDMPQVPPSLIAALLHRGPSFCADAPILGYWPAALTDDLEANLRHPGPLPGSTQPPVKASAAPWPPVQGRGDEDRKDKRLSLRRFASSIGALPIPAPAPLANVNTPADLAAL